MSLHNAQCYAILSMKVGSVMHALPEIQLLKGNSAMADVQVTCITKPHPQSPHEHITHLGNPQVGWEWTREQVIASIEARTNTFFVLDPRTGKRSDVGVVRP